MNQKVLFGFLAVLVCYCVAETSIKKVPVTVYYESLCPDSKKFFTSQLYPTLSGNLSMWVNLTLVPYGKSKTNTLGDGNYQFECHHGPSECVGNKIQACAINKIEAIQPTPKDFGFNPITLSFINCLMDQAERNGTEYSFPIKKCAEINHVRQYVDIENCQGHPDAQKYLAQLGEMTDTFQKPIKGVPTIVFNDAFKKEDSDLAQSNFAKALCQHIMTEKPAECTEASAATLTGSLLMFVTVLFLRQLF